jgi:hypothetical protein
MQDLLKLAFKAGVAKGMKDFGIKPPEAPDTGFAMPNASSGYTPPNAQWGMLPVAGYGEGTNQPSIGPSPKKVSPK